MIERWSRGIGSLAVVGIMLTGCGGGGDSMPALQISPTTATVIGGEQQTFAASGGTTPYTFRVSQGGGSISSSGTYTAPLAVGSATVEVVDVRGRTASAGVQIVAPSPPDQPTLSADAAPKELLFSWSAAARAWTYRLMLDADGTSTYVQVGADIQAPATSVAQNISVHRLNWPNARYRLDACNAGGCASSSSITVSSLMLPAIGTLTSWNATLNDQFGLNVALSGDGRTLVAGAPQEKSTARGINGDQNDTSGQQVGAAYIFTFIGGEWFQQAYLKAAVSNSGDRFGDSVAISADGNTVAVGAPNESGGGLGIGADPNDLSAPYTGAAYIFVRNGDTWSQQAYIKSTSNHPASYFGTGIALSSSGDVLAVGSAYEGCGGSGIDPPSCFPAYGHVGAAFTYRRAATVWSADAYIKASNPSAGDLFGYRVALSGDGATLAVAAIYEGSADGGIDGDQTDESAPQSGAVYVFSHASGAWAQQAYIKAVAPTQFDGFGMSLGLSESGDRLIVGNFNDASAATGIDGDPLDNSALGAGSAFLYSRQGGAWSQEAYLKASNAQSSDQFGSAVAISGDGRTIAVGAYGEMGSSAGVDGEQTDNSAVGSGAAYVFQFDGLAWAQQSYLKARTVTPIAAFGMSIGLSTDGSTVAVGSRYSANGTQPGSISLY